MMKRKEKYTRWNESYASGPLQTQAPRRRLEISCHRKLGTAQLRRDRVPPLAISARFYRMRFKRRASGGVPRSEKYGFTG
jgi:hypothetical protein